jgi:hypothetical protein
MKNNSKKDVMRFRVQCIVDSTIHNEFSEGSQGSHGPEFEDHWIGASTPLEAHTEFLKLYEGRSVIDMFSENGERCIY